MMGEWDIHSPCQLLRIHGCRDELRSRNGDELFLELEAKDQYKKFKGSRAGWSRQLVGIHILWARYFMQEQGYKMDASLLYQDNMSAILLETNRRASSSKRTKHIKVKCYLIKDKVGLGEITIEHCMAKQIWTEINTKPKQGLVFCVFMGHVMGIPAEYRDADYEGKVLLLSPNVSMLSLTKEQLALQECVGGNVRRQALTRTNWIQVSMTESANDRLTGKKSLDVEAHAVTLGSGSRAPIKMVDGGPWSPQVYRSLRLLGKTLEVAWVRAFVRTSHF